MFQPVFRRDTLALWTAFFFCMLAVYTAFNWVPSMLAGAGLDGIAHTGDPAAVQRLLGLLDEPDPTFAIVTP